MADPTRADLDLFQAVLMERPHGEPLWAAIDRATQQALMSLGPAAAGVAGAITRLAAEFEQANALVLDGMSLRRLAEGYLRARYELSLAHTETTEINLPFLSANESGPKHFLRTVSRGELSALELR